MRPVEIVSRHTVGSLHGLEHIEATEDRVYVRRRRCRRYTLRGVPARGADVLVDDRLIVAEDGAVSGPDPRDVVVVEVCDKAGRYDGAVRRRYAVVVAHGACAPTWPPTGLDISQSDGHVRVTVGDTSESWPQLRADLDDGYHLARILMWHWRRYYTHLVDDDGVRELADAWAAEHDGERWSLAEANRSASRELYRLSRDLGWRKLTLRERQRLQIQDAPQWVSESWYTDARQRAGIGSPTGCGEATLTAAATGHPSWGGWQ